MSVPLNYEPRRENDWRQRCKEFARKNGPGALLVLLTLIIGLATIVPPLIGKDTANVDGLALYGVFALPALILHGLKGSIDGRQLSRRVRTQVVGIAMVFFVGLLSVRECPHATYLSIGPIQFAVRGDPCNNVQPVKPFSWRLVQHLLSR